MTDERGARDEEPTVLPADSGVAPVPSDADSPAPAAPAPAPRTAARARRVAVTGIRLVTGSIGVAIAAAALVVMVLAPPPSAPDPAPAATVRPVPAALTRVCPGAALALGGGDGQDAATAASVGRASVVARAEGGSLERSTLTPSASEAQLLTAGAASGALLAGAQSQRLSTHELSGLATAACGDPAGTSWLVAGSTTTGRTTLLSLANPTRVDATVELRIWTDQGPVDAPGLRGIVVAAGAQKVLSLAGFAQNAGSPVVEVTSSGGRVVATAQESILRAVDPGGIDLASASAAGTRLAIPGVTISGKDAVDSLRGRSDYDDLQPVLRLLDPGSSDTTVRVGIRPERGGSGTAFDVPLTAGKVLDVPIDDLAEGAYTIELESDAPIAAGVRASTALPLSGGDALEAPVSDLVWFAAAPLVAAPTLVAAPDVASRLHVQNPGSSALTLTLTGLGTPDLTVDVPAGGSAAVALATSGVYRADPSSPVRMTVVSQVSGGIGSYPVAPPPAASSPLVLRR